MSEKEFLCACTAGSSKEQSFIIEYSKTVKRELLVLNGLVTHEKIAHPKKLSEKMAVSTARFASLLNHMEEKTNPLLRGSGENLK